MYIVVNTLVISVIIVNAIVSCCADFAKNFAIQALNIYMTFGQALFTTAVFFDAIRRMKGVFKQIPILKHSEQVFYLVVAFYVVFFVISVVSVIGINIENSSTIDIQTLLVLNIIRTSVYSLTYCGMQLAVCWIVKKYNQPLMTRKDLLTG